MRGHPVVHGILRRVAVHDQVPVKGVTLRRDAVGRADQTDELAPVGAVAGAGRAGKETGRDSAREGEGA